MMERGYLTLFRVRGVPVRAHWTLPLGALLLSGGRVAPGLWVGVLLVVALHEVGHALLVHRFGLVNLGLDLTGFVGRCRWAGHPSEVQRAAIAWGGVLAQLALLIPAIAVALFVPLPQSAFLADLLEAFTRTNAILIAFNLIPIKPLDGAEAWPLFGHLRRRRARVAKWKQKLAPQTLREALDEADRNKLH
jgi:Zn-dependent protease